MGEGRRQPTPNPSGGGEDRRQETGEMGNLEDLVEYFIPQFFCNYSPLEKRSEVGGRDVLLTQSSANAARHETHFCYATSVQSRGKELMIFAYGIDLIFDYHAYVY